MRSSSERRGTRHWVLVDYENVRPRDFDPVRQPDTNVLIFLGPGERKLPSELVLALQAFGTSARYVPCPARARNAVDFHIAYYLGETAKAHPEDDFHIVSGDTGFDPLVRHLKSERGLEVSRSARLPAFGSRGGKAGKAAAGRAVAAGRGPSVEAVLGGLRAAGRSRPRRRKTLANWIRAEFGGSLANGEVDRLIAGLKDRGVVDVVEGTVRYAL